MNKFIKLLRCFFLAAFAALMILYLPKIKFDNSLERWVPTGSPEVVHYKEFLYEFGGHCILLPVLVRLVTVKGR